MLAQLELVPRDILEHIAFLVAISSGTASRPPQALLHLLLTSSTLYYSLRTTSAPHLYARLFRCTFDTSGTSFTGSLKDSRLTAELVSRHRLLGRVRRLELSEPTMYEDLCVAMRIVMENNGVNEVHLRSTAFSPFIFTFAERCLKQHQCRSDVHSDRIIGLVLWLLALTWSRDDVACISEEARDSFLVLLRPLLFITPSDAASLIECPRGSSQSEHIRNMHSRGDADGCEDFGFVCPSAASAAILLSFIFQEAGVPKAAPQLHSNLPNVNAGPSIEDYCIMANYQTPLFSDICSSGTVCCPGLPRAVRHDPQFFHPKLPGSDAYCHIPELIAGLWEGVYMVSCAQLTKEASPPAPETTEFICKKPLQCSLTLYFALQVEPQVGAECIADEVDQWTMTPKDFSNEDDCLTVFGKKLGYEKFVSSANCNCQVSQDYSQALDCLVIGQTTEEHDRAWGGYNFAGRVNRDGTIVMKREPKEIDDAGLGTWIFQGHLRYGSAFVGRWRSSSAIDSGIGGLFSLAKRPRPSTDD
ncbi:hypothetical protein D9757_008157 [Collybiopsis confluens]|uniref:Uncharacterized protein n=1 Tax=Collybiopsis confluens TaxID=2823264 RepID=A0A8H5M529_9AGAR|nr:hypothetical protein D9757_008157 [Collybiopsis confluens]